MNPLLMNMLNYGIQQAPRVAQPIQRGITTLQNYLSPYANMIFNQAVKRPGTSGTMIPFAMSEPANVISNLVGTNTAEAAEVDDSMPPSNWMDELIEEEEELKKKKKKKKKTKKDKEEKIVEIDGEFYTIDKKGKAKKLELKKGGYVKKQRKRKHYKASGFVKMKKSKKRKYV